jgi:hypothetical protein
VFSARRRRKEREVLVAAWEQRDRDFDYRRRDLQRMIDHPELEGSLGSVNRVHMVPRRETLRDLHPIVGNLLVGPTGVGLMTADTRLIILASWEFANCQDMVVSDDDRIVWFETGGDDGTEEVMLIGSTDELGWKCRVAWRCHTDGVPAGMDLLDQIQLEHHRNRP